MMLHVLHTFRVSEPQPQPGCSRIFLSDWNVSFVFLPGPEEFQVTVTWLMSRHAFALPILFSKLANVSTSIPSALQSSGDGFGCAGESMPATSGLQRTNLRFCPKASTKKCANFGTHLVVSCFACLVISFMIKTFSQFDLSV